MRIDRTTLDPKSALARRIDDALHKERLAGRDHHRPWSRTRRGRDEETIHRDVVRVLRQRARPDVVWFHVPNGGSRHKIEAAKLKGMGTLAGVPDLIIIVDGAVHGLELKAGHGRRSRAQRDVARRFADAGSHVAEARTVEDATALLVTWMALTSTPPKA
jgi:hypothetical protein